MKNKIYRICVLAVMFAFVTACDKGFDELNTNEYDATSLDPAFILNRGLSLFYPVLVVMCMKLL